MIIMKKLYLILSILVSSIILSAQNYYNIYNDTTWNSDTIFISDNVTVHENATLAISPGTTINFEGQYYIEVLGKLMAIGQLNDSILFTINDTTYLSDTSTILGGWKGIHLLDNTNDTSVFDYCILQYGKAVKPGVPYTHRNHPENHGGVMYIDGYNCVSINNSKFRNNLGRDKGGAIYADTMSCFTVKNSEFHSNICNWNGGAIYAGNIDDVVISNNIFLWNESFLVDTIAGWIGWSGTGGGIHLSNPLGNSKATIINNEFYNNIASSGTIYDAFPNTILYNNILCNNRSITYYCGSPYSHSIFSNNIVANNFYLGGSAGIACNSDHLQIKNSIIWNNQTLFPHDQDQIYNPLDYHPTIEYNCVYDGYVGEGNIDSPPMFVNPTEGTGLDFNGADADWSLLDNSPCINTGTPDTTGLNLPEFDIDNNPRIFGNRIEMGAYENQFVWVKVNDSPVFNKSVKVYPNPSRENLYIALQPGMEGAWIELVDGTGKRLIHSQITTIPAMFSPTGIKPGIYFYRIYNKQIVIKTGKWVKM